MPAKTTAGIIVTTAVRNPQRNRSQAGTWVRHALPSRDHEAIAELPAGTKEGAAVMLNRCAVAMLAVVTSTMAASAQTVKSQDIDLDAFARKVAQETIRSLREAGALKEPEPKRESENIATPRRETWQTSTSSMTPTSAHTTQPHYRSHKDSFAPPVPSKTKQRKLSGWEAGIEAVIAKPVLGADHGTNCCRIQDRTPSHDAVVSPRFWISWMSESGFGLRARYFDLSSESKTIGGETEPNGNIDWLQERFNYSTADVEMAYHDTWTNWDVIWGLGARYIEMSAGFTGNDNDTPVAEQSSFKGVGPLASVELRRRISSGLTPFALLRAGFVVGEARSDSDVNDDDLYVVDNMMGFYEASAGIEYARNWRGSTTLFFKAALEAMYMPGGAIFTEKGADHEDDNLHLAILGGTVTFGIRY